MISNILTKDHKALIKVYKAMSPEQRLTAFLNHSRLVHKLYQAGKPFRRSPLNLSLLKKLTLRYGKKEFKKLEKILKSKNL